MTSSATIPGDEGTDDFYDGAPLEPHLVYQGEILIDVPILRMPRPARWQLLRTRSGLRLDDALEHGNIGGQVRVLDSNQSKEQWQENGEGDFAMAVLAKSPVLVLNQTCDVQNNDFLQVAPVFSASADPQDLEKLRSGGIFSTFWLKKRPPEIPDESYADFELIQAIHKTYVKRIVATQHFRLGPERIRLLQRSLTRYFGRPNSFDSRSDLSPRAGIYLCVRCFYKEGRVTSIQLDEGSSFPACESCAGTSSTWVAKDN